MIRNDMNREKLMMTIMQSGFAMDDVKLFLDTHPYCSEAMDYYCQAKKVRDEAVQIYAEKYGPLSAYDVEDTDYWNWNEGPMPWEGGNC